MGSRLSKFTPPSAGLGLGGLGLVAVWQRYGGLADIVLWVGLSMATLLLALLAARYWQQTDQLQSDLKHPLLGSVMATVPMLCMLMAKSLSALSPLLYLSMALWGAALLLHLCLLWIFLRYRRPLGISHWLPSWFIPTVGIAMAAASYPGPAEWSHLASLSLALGALFFALMLPVMLLRLTRYGPLPKPAKASIAILAAPASLLLEGYFTITPTEQIQPALVLLLGSLALVMTIATYACLPKVFQQPFSPTLAATTFPLVISANALFCFVEWLESQGSPAAEALNMMAWFELWVATVVVIGVSARFVWYWRQPLPVSNSEPV